MVLTSLHPCWISVSKGPLMGPLLDVITKLVLNFYDNGEQIVHILCQLYTAAKPRNKNTFYVSFLP